MLKWYILYSVKVGGWFTISSTYSSDWKHARRYSKDEALELAAKQKSQTGFGLIPVRVEDLEAL